MRVGADVFAQCRRCGETWHVVVAVVPNRKSRVECKQCGGRHGYSTPASEKVLNPPSRKAHKSVPADPSRPLRSYSRNDHYEAGDRITHPSFGEGVVQSVSGPKKVRILFAMGERVLVQSKAG